MWDLILEAKEVTEKRLHVSLTYCCVKSHETTISSLCSQVLQVRNLEREQKVWLFSVVSGATAMMSPMAGGRLEGAG